MSGRHNAEIGQLFYDKPLGVLAPGACADIILLDYLPTTPLTDGNYPWHVMFGIDGCHVDTTIVGGQVLMRHRCLLTLDAEAIHSESRRQAQRLWDRVQAGERVT
jgi:cytosine/adenosine deaminase-related metal-dependent hydrolase